MQILKVSDPQTRQEFELQASPVQLEGQQGWKVRFEEGNEITLTTDQHGIWKQIDGNVLSAAFIPVIGNAIERQMSSDGF